MLSLLSLLFTIGCSMSPAMLASSPPRQAAARPNPDPVPVPHEGLKLSVDIADGGQSMLEVLDQFTRVTGQTLVIETAARDVLQGTKSGLNRNMDVPPGDVYFVIETLLVERGFFLTQLNDREPRMLGVYVRPTVTNARRIPPTLVRAEEMASYARHPALLIATTIELPYTDVSALSNVVRPFATDSGTGLVPVGNTRSVLITGFGPSVVDMVDALRNADAVERRLHERREAEREAIRKAELEERARRVKAEEEKLKESQGTGSQKPN